MASPNTLPPRSAAPGRSDRVAPPGIYLISLAWGAIALRSLASMWMAPDPPGIVVFLFLLVLAQLVVIYGLLTLEPWAWLWGLLFMALGIVVSLVTADVIGITINGIAAWYIARKKSLYLE